ncbi:hypothetical protein SEUCBS139899_007415 [Sporothrix eucalyptigena]
MPPINPVVVSAGVIAISVAVVAVIAAYESPEIRRIADDLRRRIAVAADDIFGDDERRRRQNAERESEAGEQPVFNRPEDAEGFMISRGNRSGNDPGVVADEASRRRQREELMYWNAVKQAKAEADAAHAQRVANNPNTNKWQPRETLEALQKATRDAAAAAGIHLPSLGGPHATQQPRPKTSFDQFMRPDHNADRGTFVVNTGASTEDPLNGGIVRRRKPEGVRGLHAAAAYANPFGDEYGIELDDQNEAADNNTSRNVDVDAQTHEAFNSRTAYTIVPDRDETLSDIYNATEPDTNTQNNNLMDAVFDPLPSIPETAPAATSEVFFDVNDYTNETKAKDSSPDTMAATDVDSQLSLRLFRKPDGEPEGNEEEEDVRDILPSGQFDASRQDINTEAYNSIQAWAQTASMTTVATANSSNAGSGPGFYSPLPVTPSVGRSEPSVISSNAGDATPTGTGSVWGDDHSVISHADAVSTTGSAALLQQAPAAPTTPIASAAGSDYGVLSEDDEEDACVLTPTSWSEVGSVVSESDSGMQAVRQ